ncbi:MAG: hypothetical protein KDC33_08580 [Thermoleophilia bacterium]|nr:hypothetical protein [Thermoleophilia bacterium]
MDDAAEPPAAPLTGRERRLRRWLVAVAALAALAAVAVGAILFYWARYVLPTEPDPFTRGPFVAAVDRTSAHIAWRIPAGRRVEITATTPSGRTVAAADGRLKGLDPGARHGWVATVDGRAAAWGSVTTAPGDDGAVRFLAFGDYGAGGEDEYAVGRVGAAQSPAFSVIPGDNSYLVAVAPLLDKNIFRPMRPLLAQGPFVATLGEHDVFIRNGRDLADALFLPGGGDRWVFDHGPLRFVMLGVEANEDDVPFAERALARRDARRTYLVVHRPPQPGNAVLRAARGRFAAVFAGHNHRYERRVVDGVLTLTVGTGGAPANQDERFTPRSPDAIRSFIRFGLMRVDDTPDGATMVFIDSAGRVRDRVAIP